MALVGIALAGLGPAPAQGQDAVVGSWEGLLDAGAMELRIVFHIEPAAGGGFTASMDSPDQGAEGIPVSSVTVDGDRVALEVEAIGGRYEGTLAEDGASIDGTWSQGGQSFPLALEPAGEEETARARPQHPEPPHSYATEEVTFENEADGLTLAGTLSLPEEGGPHPAVVLASGSGPQDRNAEVFGHKLFLVLADHLTREGIAVLRYDERGVGASEGAPWPAATTEAFARDVAAGARFLKAHPDVHSDAVGLIGLSEGGLVGPLVHTEHEAVAFLALLAAPSVPGHEVLAEQHAQVAAAQGMEGAALDSARATQRRLLDVAHATPDSATAAAELEVLLREEGLPEGQVAQQVEQLTSPWFRYFLSYDPAPALRAVDAPALALYGERDLQVPPGQNAGPMRAALEESPSGDVTVEIFDGLNHLFQPAESGLPSEYGQIETTMAPEVLETLATWIRERAPAGQ